MFLVTFMPMGNSDRVQSATVPSHFNGPEILSSVSDKAKLFHKIFFKNSILMTQEALYLLSMVETIWDYTISV